MTNYDFQTILSPLDFEYLVRDLLSKELNIELTSFAEGKDSGIDLRYANNKSRKTIVQCKRVKTISKKQIFSELPKIKKLNPEKYIFVVSNDLSPDKFDFIKETFGDWMENDDSIYTRSKLNQLLDKHKSIHQRHYKLWLNTATIFNDLINIPLFERAKSLITDLKKDYKYYVKNDSLKQAFEILNNNQFIVISGIPGIGKTTLAKLVLWEYLQRGFEIIEIRKVLEGEQILTEDSDKRQVFYYDDFLGENFLKFDVIEGRSNDLIQFINRIKNSKDKILIMTTREYILNQAKEVYEKLDTTDLNIAKHTLDLSTYSKRIRAQILYNHLFYSKIPIEYIESIISNKAYKKIINHKNYSPRIIEQLTTKLNNIEASDYATQFIYNLDYPFGIWAKAFNSQISQGSQYTLYSLLSISNPILLSDFKNALKYYYNNGTKHNELNFKPFDFKNYLKELENSFIKINVTDKNNHYVDFLNPSIKDFLLSFVRDDKDLVLLLIKSCLYFDQFIYTIRYLAVNFIEDNDVINLINSKILADFNTFSNPQKIHPNQRETSIVVSSLLKIHNLKFYFKKSKDKTLNQFIIDEFKSVSLQHLNFNQEKKYIEFYIDYEKELELELVDIIELVVNNISWYDNVKNLTLLRSVNETTFDNYMKDNEELINEKIKDSVLREIEFHDNENGLEYFKNSLTTDIDLSLYSISIAEFDSYFDEKYIKIEDRKDSDDEKEKVEVDIEKINETEDYDEDELFKIEMF
ncbi:restriction endonuclease [uncultured Tenacibaculum sp.]|uniref:nSTAND3 domain-containing NTPase n=1 Tax=uncultured Tenacibaculum sp. TaxID=174713 RepID=UPI0026318D24|nr:restriction endonuclease [uncultured Tenacibaculum sp.]